MKNFILICLAATLFISGCSTYKAGSTPDDVYYSPAKAVPVAADRYEDYSNGDDNYLRMKVRNHYQWNGIDDYSYWNDSRYDFGYSCSPSREVMLSPYYGIGIGSPYFYRPWGNWYNPMYTVVYYKTPRAYFGNTSKSNLSAYRNNNYNRQSFGSLLKGAFNNNNNNNNNSTDPSRSFSTGSSPSNSAGGRSGGMSSSGSSSSSPRPPR